MKRIVIVLAVLAAGFVIQRTMRAPGTPASAGDQTMIGRGLAAGAAVRTDASKQYFERQLIDAGGGSGQPFGTALAALGLDGRQLQALPIEQAFTLAHEAVMKVDDIATRRRYLLELFNETER